MSTTRAIWLLLLLPACSSSGQAGQETDTGSSTEVSSLPTDTESESVDTGSVTGDTGSETMDTSSFSTSSDTLTQSDTDTPPDTESSTDPCFGLPDFTPCQVVTEPDRDYDICASGVCVSPGCGDPSCNAPGMRYPLGPDAGHAEYTRTTDEEAVVIDNLTGLMWQGCERGRSGAMCEVGNFAPLDWLGAIAYCDELDYAGFDDWRLPDRYEGFSRASMGMSPVDAWEEFYPDKWKCLDYYWTSSLDAYRGSNESGTDSFTRAWVYLTEPLTYEIDRLFRVQCVRGGEPLEGPRFERTTDDQPLVYDTVTGLTWMGCPLGLSGADCDQGQIYVEFDEPAAEYLCNNLTWAGHDDWIVPDARALFSLTDDRNDNPGSRQDGFTPVIYEAFFTSTRGYDWDLFGNGYYMVVFGPGIMNDLTGLGAILCVRAYE